MKRFAGLLGLIVALLASFVTCFPQSQRQNEKFKSQEISDDDGLPVIVKHLPDWESRRKEAVFVNDLAHLKAALGDRPVLDLIDFAGGTEAVTAPYPAGKLLIVEFTNPQSSIDADSKIAGYLAEHPDGASVYKRIGNYNVFAFDASDPAAAAALVDQVKYEKNVQWLGEDPFLFRNLERHFVNTTADIFVSTVEWVVLGMGSTLLLGLLVGYGFFYMRGRHRLAMDEFSDAGGMVRLNLDGLTPDIPHDRLLTE